MKKNVILEITPACICQRETGTNKLLACYDYKDIDYVQNVINFFFGKKLLKNEIYKIKVSDTPNGFVIANNGFSRLHMFQCDDRDNFLRAVLDYSGNYTGISLRLRKEQFTVDQFWNEKFGKYR